MAVDNADVVDAIGIENATGIVALTICDHLEWDDANVHLVILHEKINRYLAFVESGELLESYPDALGKPDRIDVVCKYAPSATAQQFLEQVRNAIERAGLSFSWRVPDVGIAAGSGGG